MQNDVKTSEKTKTTTSVSSFYSYYALVVFSILNLLNYVDRFIFSALIPSIKTDMKFTDEQIGYLGSAFTIVYTIFSPLYGYLADRRARGGLVSSGVAIWSIATAASGVAQSYWHMLIARAAVGIGEASYATISPGFLSDYFERNKRGFAFGIFFSAIPLGQALGYILAGLLSPPEVLGWRHTLFVVGIPGIFMAVAAHFLREPERGKYDVDDAEKVTSVDKSQSLSPSSGSLIESYKLLAKNYYYIVATLGYSAVTFALGALSYWGLEMLVSSKGMEKGEASVKLGIYVTLGGLIGSLFGGWLGDRLVKKVKSGYYIICGSSAALSAIPLTITLSSPDPSVFFPAIFVTVFLFFLGNAPVNAIIVSVVPANIRATAVATTILAIHVLGDAVSQPLVGIISTSITKQNEIPSLMAPFAVMLGLGVKQSLAIGMLITPVALVIAGGFYLLGLIGRQKAENK
jgi:MFS family permease